MIKNIQLKEHGFVVADFPLEACVQRFVQDKNWKALDQYFLEISKQEGHLYQFLSEYVEFNIIEHIIAIRSSPEDEDGIWHDDGSRTCGFSLSLNLNPESISGGELRFKKKDSPLPEIFPALPCGKIVIFLSGIYGYEHMVSAVTKSERIVIAGWCT